MTRFYTKFYTAAEVRDLEAKARQEGYNLADVRKFGSFAVGTAFGALIGLFAMFALILVSLEEGARIVIVQGEVE